MRCGPELKSVKRHPWLSEHAECLLVVAHVVVSRMRSSFRSSVLSPLPTALSAASSALPGFPLSFFASLFLLRCHWLVYYLFILLLHEIGENLGLFLVDLVERLNQNIFRAELSSKSSSEGSSDKSSELRAHQCSVWRNCLSLEVQSQTS